jgi:hypothetical protein
LVRPITEPGVEFVDIYFPGGETEVWIPMTSNDVQRGTGWASVNISNQAVRNQYRRHQNVGISFLVDPILLQKRWRCCQKKSSEGEHSRDGE